MYPGGHVVHKLLPVPVWNVPAEQLVQLAVPPVEYVPAAQLKQLVAPAEDWYVPGLQFTQEVDAMGEYFPEVHCAQLDDDAAPVLDK